MRFCTSMGEFVIFERCTLGKAALTNETRERFFFGVTPDVTLQGEWPSKDSLAVGACSVFDAFRR